MSPQNLKTEIADLIAIAQKQADELENTLDKLQILTNSGACYYTGAMMNPYGITENKEKKNTLSDITEMVKDNLVYTISRKIQRWLGEIRILNNSL